MYRGEKIRSHLRYDCATYIATEMVAWFSNMYSLDAR
jgi:hypothetical protein